MRENKLFEIVEENTIFGTFYVVNNYNEIIPTRTSFKTLKKAENYVKKLEGSL